jgi:ubiquinone/menaquinone biosynthesis C-methylase UbiE
MSSRGESSFSRLPGFGARLYDSMSRAHAIKAQFKEIAQFLVSRVKGGRVLDVGMGPGRLLLEIHRLNPALELYGLDVSGSMVRLAGQNLAGIKTDLRQGSIEQTDFGGNFFDLVTCTGSFYLWERPEACLGEVFRILKGERSAYLFETYSDYNHDAFRDALRVNLRNETLLRKLLTPAFLKRQLRMTYRSDEVVAIIGRTAFADSYSIEKAVLAGLPIWLRIELAKPAA